MVEQVRCYAPGASTSSKNYDLIPLPTAIELVRDGFAETFKRGRSIRLFARTLIRLRDRSCSWSHRLMQLVAEGNQGAVAMAEWLGERA